MAKAFDEVKRRREYQFAINKKLRITPRPIHKPIREKLIDRDVEAASLAMEDRDIVYARLPDIDVDALTPMDKKRLARKLRREMKIAAEALNFELAIEIRNKVRELEV
jgi:excinuclease UvrABC helicase subunit UvrB